MIVENLISLSSMRIGSFLGSRDRWVIVSVCPFRVLDVEDRVVWIYERLVQITIIVLKALFLHRPFHLVGDVWHDVASVLETNRGTGNVWHWRGS